MAKQHTEKEIAALLNFRKDEMIFHSSTSEDLNDSDKELSDEDTVLDEEHHIKHVDNTEEASEMVSEIEGRVDKMQDAIANMDKRMSYNIRLLGSIMYESETKK